MCFADSVPVTKVNSTAAPSLTCAELLAQDAVHSRPKLQPCGFHVLHTNNHFSSSQTHCCSQFQSTQVAPWPAGETGPRGTPQAANPTWSSLFTLLLFMPQVQLFKLGLQKGPVSDSGSFIFRTSVY